MNPTPAPFDDHTFSAPDGLGLHARIYAPAKESHGDVICLPGLTRNGRDFHDLALHLSQNADRPKRVVAMDMRGRGRSAYAPDFKTYNVITEAEDVLNGMTALGIHHADFIGTSRGGLIIHMLAAMRPAALNAIIFNDIGPVVEPVGLMQIKAYLDRSPLPKDWADAFAIQKSLHEKEFPSLKTRDWEVHARAIYRETEDKRIVSDYDPNLLKTLNEVDPTVPLPALWPQFAGLRGKRLMVIRGENSKLLSETTVSAMKKAHPGMVSVDVPGQGHAPMLWTAGLPEMIGEFLAGTG
jgi:pimeloyl-ACP methyl ester carboxylesterase